MTLHYLYPPRRDVLFVFGAGASYADGAPLQRDILPLFLSGSFFYTPNSPIGRPVVEFLQEYFHWDAEAGYYPPLEGVFAFLDYLIEQGQSLGERFPNDRLRLIRESLILVIHHIISASTGATKTTYRRFWQEVGRRNRNISVITLNYDTLLDEAFDPLFAEVAIIDYCIDLLNYDHLIDIDPFDWWIDPRGPLPKWSSGNSPVPIKLIRPHGSLNWKYCSTCNGVLLTPWNTVVDLETGTLKSRDPNTLRISLERQAEYRCPRDGTLFRTLLLPPSYWKSLRNPRIAELMLGAAAEIRAARKIVFIGYSLPDADAHIKALFAQNLSKTVSVLVVDPAHNPDLKCRYQALSPSVRFFNSPLKEVLADESAVGALFESGTSEVGNT